MTPAAAAPDLRPNLAARLWRSSVWRELAFLALLLATSLGLRLATYHPVADGGGSRYLKATLVGGVAAALVWWLVRIQTGPGSRLPPICAGLLLLSGDAVHYARLANPITRGAPVMSFAASFADEAATRRQWEFETSGGGTVAFERGAVLLESPPGATAYLRPNPGGVPDARANWWLPVGLAERERTERLTWRARIARTGSFYAVAEIRNLLVQAVSYGVHITYLDPDRRQALRGWEIQHPAGSDGQVHEWQLARDSQKISLIVDGQALWAAPQREALDQIRLGETRADPQHGGSMRLEGALYAATLEPRSP